MIVVPPAAEQTPRTKTETLPVSFGRARTVEVEPLAIASAEGAVSAVASVAPPAGGDETELAAEAEPTGAFYQPEVETHIEPGKPQNRFVRAWKKIGGGSLTLSLLIHGGLILLAGALVIATRAVERTVDFLPGGGSQQGAEASSELAHKVQMKKQHRIKRSIPMQKVVSNNMLADIVLPEAPPDVLDVPDVSAMLGGKMGSGGFGSGGTGGGFGSGHGSGGMRGITFKPVMMFGRELKNTKKIAVVMDVSRSMTRYLPTVAKELDKVASRGPLILYFGCGLATWPERDKQGNKLPKIEDEVFKATGPAFDRFWQLWQGKTPLQTPAAERKLLQYDPGKPMPLPEIYQQMSKRPDTYFIEFNGIQYAWTALMCEQVQEADTIYWFADFQDRVDEAMMKEVLKKLKLRKQKLYIHASIQGRSFERVRDGLVIPNGGEVIETKVEQ